MSTFRQNFKWNQFWLGDDQPHVLLSYKYKIENIDNFIWKRWIVLKTLGFFSSNVFAYVVCNVFRTFYNGLEEELWTLKLAD